MVCSIRPGMQINQIKTNTIFEEIFIIHAVLNDIWLSLFNVSTLVKVVYGCTCHTHITLACKNTCVTALCDALSSSPVPLMMRVSLWPLLSSVPAVPLVVVVFPLFVAPVVMVVMMVWRFLFLCLFRERVWIRLLFGKRPRGATVMMMMMMVMAVVFVTASPFTRLLVVVSFSVSLLGVVIVQTSLLLSLVLMMMMMMMVVFIKARLLTRSALIWKHMSGIMQLYGFANTN